MKYKLIILLLVVLSPIKAQEPVELNYQFLNEVGIDSEAYSKYESLINTKGLVEKTIVDDPIIVLGMYSENDQDRKKYAKMYLDREVKRADRMMKFINIYYEVFDEEIGSKPMVDMSSFNTNSNKIDLSNETMAVFFSVKCKTCKGFTSGLQSMVRSSKIKKIDFYFKDHSSDEEINIWAKEAGIDINLVNKNLISLNSGTALSKELGIVEESKIYVRRGQRLEELKLTDLIGMY